MHGSLGYRMFLGLTDLKASAGLLGRIIPTQISMKTEKTQTVRFKSIDEVMRRYS